MDNQSKERLLHILDNPYSLDNISLSFLRKMTEAYPYCQTLQILLAKNLEPIDKIAFEKQVNKASTYATDRRIFQRYISERDRISSTPEESQTYQKPEFIELEGQNSFHEEQIIATVLQNLNNQQTKEELHKEELESNLSESSDVKIVSEIEKLQENPTEEKTQTLQNLEHPSQNDKETQDNQQINSKREIETRSEKNQSLLNIVKKRLQEIRKNKEDATIFDPSEKEINEPLISDKVSESEEEALRDIDDKIVNQSQIPKPKPSEGKKAEEKFDYESFGKGKQRSYILESIEDDENATKEKTTENESTASVGFRKKPDINELINRFLKEEPRIKAKKDLPQKQEDLSAPSTNESSQLVSETLAVVYLKQGNKSKALDIYEKLCLKFPEKSSYFAKKITDIKNELD